MELPTGFVETQAHGFYIITRPAYFKTALAVAASDPEKLLSAPAGAAAAGPMQGRGARIELPGEGGDTLILKKQRRGGLYGRFMGDVHRDDYRAVAEVYLSETAWKKGVPVALVAFAMSAPAGDGRLASWRRGYVATIRLDGARNLMEWLSTPLPGQERRAVLAAAAQAVGRAHDRGFQHGDLNLGNILVVKSAQGDHSGWMIDLQGSKLGGTLRTEPRLSNLVRLYRSAEKWLPDPDLRRRLRDIAWFLRCYTRGEAGQVRLFVEGARRHRASLFLHRLGWKAARRGKVTRRSTAPAGR